jgi:lipid-binding SYLF domain-containing protein
MLPLPRVERSHRQKPPLTSPCAEILSYSRARGLFAGVSLAGSSVRPDNSANIDVYHKRVSAQDIVFKGAVSVPASAQKMVAYLQQEIAQNLLRVSSSK